LSSNLKQILADNQEYTQVSEQLNVLGEKRKQILTNIANEFPDLFNEIATIKMHEKNDKELLSDLAVNQLISGEMIEVVDADGNKYQPIFSVKFKKA